MAQYACAPGYTYYNGVCQPVQPQGYGNPVSGAVSGEAAGAAQGAQTGGPVGAVVGGAIGTATGALQGTGNMLSGGSTPPPTTQYWVDTFADAPGYSSPGGTATGTLNAGTNYVFCKKWGPEVSVGSSYNHYWMLTDLDSGNPWHNQYVSAYYLSHWGNDEARDNNGTVLPDCP